MEPYYPINDERNSKLYQLYQELAKTEKHVVFARQLEEYKYYDMAPIVGKVLDIWNY